MLSITITIQDYGLMLPLVKDSMPSTQVKRVDALAITCNLYSYLLYFLDSKSPLLMLIAQPFLYSINGTRLPGFSHIAVLTLKFFKSPYFSLISVTGC